MLRALDKAPDAFDERLKGDCRISLNPPPPRVHSLQSCMVLLSLSNTSKVRSTEMLFELHRRIVKSIQGSTFGQEPKGEGLSDAA